LFLVVRTPQQGLQLHSVVPMTLLVKIRNTRSLEKSLALLVLRVPHHGDPTPLVGLM
jgi:hypothetical protein